MDIDLSKILTETSAFVAGSVNASEQIGSLVSQGTEINKLKQQASLDAATAAQTKVGVELTELGRQEAIRKSIAARLGTDSSLAGSVVSKFAEITAVADKGLAETDAAITAKESINFLENPLGWIAGRMTVGEDYAKYNAFARMRNRAEDSAKQAYALTKEAFQVDTALSATTTAAYTDAMKVLGAHTYNMQAFESATQGLRWNMEGIVTATQASRDRLQVLYSANSAVMQEKQFQNELARLRLANAEFSMRKAAHDEKMSEDSLILKYIGDGYFNFTGKPMDGATASQAMILYKSKHPDAMAMFESGLASSKITGGSGVKPVISLSPAKAADLVGQGKVTNMSPAMTQVGEQLVTWRRSFENPAVQNQYPYDPKDKNSRELAFNKYVEDQKRMSLSNTSKDSVFAPYPIQKVAALNKNIAALPVWKNVLAPAANTGIDINDPNIAFGLVTAAMREGKLSYPDAVDLSLMYAAGLDLNNQTRNFIAFGISPVKSYNSAITVPGTFGKTTVNLVDQKTLATALNKAEAVHANEKFSRQVLRMDK
jgi:hypothetical protein